MGAKSPGGGGRDRASGRGRAGGPPNGEGEKESEGEGLEGERGAADGQKGQRRGVDGKAEWVQIGVARHDGTATCEPNAKPGIK